MLQSRWLTMTSSCQLSVTARPYGIRAHYENIMVIVMGYIMIIIIEYIMDHEICDTKDLLFRRVLDLSCSTKQLHIT